MHIFLALFFYVLVSQWIDSGRRYCRYSNGEILTTMAVNLCPLSIDRPN